jgi:hypothetical protein
LDSHRNLLESLLEEGEFPIAKQIVFLKEANFGDCVFLVASQFSRFTDWQIGPSLLYEQLDSNYQELNSIMQYCLFWVSAVQVDTLSKSDVF